MKLQRYEKNPILKPIAKHPWEAAITTNPGVWYDEQRREVVMLYRAAGHDPEHVVRLGLARSKDGFHFEREPQPVFEPSADGFDAGCVEDPRIVKFGKHYFVTYATRPCPPGEYWLYEQASFKPPVFPDEFPQILRHNWTASGLAITEDFKHWRRAGTLTDTTVDDRDVILFPERINGRCYMLHRPMGWTGEKYGSEYPAIWIASGDDWLHMRESQLLIKARYDWETKVGGNTPPIRTAAGWLTLYHGVGPDKQYRLGALLLDLKDPTCVWHRTPDWILQPEADYEFDGPYSGCIFPCGKVVMDGRLYVYYGAADKYVGVATCDLEELLSYLQSCPQ